MADETQQQCAESVSANPRRQQEEEIQTLKRAAVILRAHGFIGDDVVDAAARALEPV